MTTATKINKISFQTKQLITETVYEVLSDPDFGLELREDFKKSLASARRGRKFSLAQIKKLYS